MWLFFDFFKKGFIGVISLCILFEYSYFLLPFFSLHHFRLVSVGMSANESSWKIIQEVGNCTTVY